jgi:energy-coupling factor transport system substrate-specific component
MEQHWKLKDLGLTIVFSVIYFAVVLAATIMGGNILHPKK